MTHDAQDTRRRLLEAATRGFAEHGVHGASLLEITRQAGQRNRGAVHYHFGSRDGMLVAVLEQFKELIADREAELLDEARGGRDLASVVRAMVRPAVELAETDWRGRCYLMILAELVEDGTDAVDPEVREALERTAGYEAYTMLEQRVPPMPTDVRSERLRLVTSFILRSVADRSRADARRHHPPPPLPTARFAANLAAMVAGMLEAPAE